MNKEIMRTARFEEEVKLVEAGLCPFCKKEIVKGSFRDALSEREFQISGLCQKCQDETSAEMEG
jgi:hypothetical protein